MERGQSFNSIRDLRAGVTCRGKCAHQQLSAGCVIVGYQDSLSRFLTHLSFCDSKAEGYETVFFVFQERWPALQDCHPTLDAIRVISDCQPANNELQRIRFRRTQLMKLSRSLALLGTMVLLSACEDEPPIRSTRSRPSHYPPPQSEMPPPQPYENGPPPPPNENVATNARTRQIANLLPRFRPETAAMRPQLKRKLHRNSGN